MLGTGPSAMGTLLLQVLPSNSPENACSFKREGIPNTTGCVPLSSPPSLLSSFYKCRQIQHLSLDASVPHSDSGGHQQNQLYWIFCELVGKGGLFKWKVHRCRDLFGGRHKSLMEAGKKLGLSLETRDH